MASITLVMPRTPIFGLEEVEPFPVPKKPAMIQQKPSVKIPLRDTNTLCQTPVGEGRGEGSCGSVFQEDLHLFLFTSCLTC